MDIAVIARLILLIVGLIFLALAIWHGPEKDNLAPGEFYLQVGMFFLLVELSWRHYGG